MLCGCLKPNIRTSEVKQNQPLLKPVRMCADVWTSPTRIRVRTRSYAHAPARMYARTDPLKGPHRSALTAKHPGYLQQHQHLPRVRTLAIFPAIKVRTGSAQGTHSGSEDVKNAGNDGGAPPSPVETPDCQVSTRPKATGCRQGIPEGGGCREGTGGKQPTGAASTRKSNGNGHPPGAWIPTEPPPNAGEAWEDPDYVEPTAADGSKVLDPWDPGYDPAKDPWHDADDDGDLS